VLASEVSQALPVELYAIFSYSAYRSLIPGVVGESKAVLRRTVEDGPPHAAEKERTRESL